MSKARKSASDAPVRFSEIRKVDGVYRSVLTTIYPDGLEIVIISPLDGWKA